MELKTKNAIFTSLRKVSCSGFDSVDKHPLIYLCITKKGTTCPYCSKIFVFKNSSSQNETL